MLQTNLNAWNELLERPVPVECRDHIVQFYESADFLAQSVARYVITGLELGEAVILIARADHLTEFKRELIRQGQEARLERALDSGQLKLLDAHETLSRFMGAAGLPDTRRFEMVIGGLIDVISRTHPRIRAYGEMVDILRHDGNIQGMIALEQHWNNLARVHSFSLLCGYQMDGFADEAHSAAFTEVCDTHTHVLPGESYSGLENAQEQLREIAHLQRQSRSLREELKRRREIEEALHQSEVFSKAIIESSRDCIKVLDLDAKLLFMSQAGMKALELDETDSVIGQRYFDFWQGEVREEAVRAFNAASRGDAGEFTGYFPTTKTQTPKFWSVVMSPMLDEQGVLWRILVVSRDVTEQKLLELELREAVQARDEFLSIASHELKTPITSLKLHAQLTQRRLEKAGPTGLDPKYALDLVQTTTQQAERLTRLVDDMLDISRIAHGKLHLDLEEMDLGALLRDVVDRFSAQLDAAGCRYRLSVESHVTGRWDRYRIEQVVINLLTNAMKYGAGKPVEFSARLEDGKAVLMVRDEGMGIAPENCERIFRRFERAISASAISGLGLGLYISRQIIESHRGIIRAESVLGAGSRFIVELPLQALPS